MLGTQFSKMWELFRVIITLMLLTWMSPNSCASLSTHVLRMEVVSSEEQATAVKQLLRRLVPARADSFIIRVDSTLCSTHKDAFKLQNVLNKTQITGSTGYAAAYGVHYYLKFFCGSHISWSGDQLQLPDKLPLVKTPVKVVLNDKCLSSFIIAAVLGQDIEDGNRQPVAFLQQQAQGVAEINYSTEKFRYYQNVCTASYSFVWWNWTRWEREIDWMALNGINLPLAFTGQEGIWKMVFKSFNFTDHDINEFFTGPAFLAWNRMGNIQLWGGPLSNNWHSEQKLLQHRILDRMRSFGMTPVLPAFSGRVPPGILRIYPNASVSTLSKTWGHFNPPYGGVMFLEPNDPLFKKMGTDFLKKYIQEFGSNHIYSADLFNEMEPPSTKTKYLAECAKSVFETMQAVDSKAVWLLQGWMFFHDPTTWQPAQVKAFVTSVPKGHLVILDLQSELFPQYQKFSSYYGQPFIWCMLHNYGGVTGLYGSLNQVNEGPFEGRKYANSTMIGTGLTPEGIETNDVVYELMNEMGWRKEPVNLDEWLVEYANRRYGNVTHSVVNAWLLLKRSVYNASSPFRNHGKYILTTRPSLHMSSYIWYDVKDAFKAWRLFVNATFEGLLNKSKLFQHDLVDVSRQGLQLVMAGYYEQMKTAFQNKNIDALKTVSAAILNLYNDLEVLLASDVHFLLGPWLHAAKSWAAEPLEIREFEYNARNQITLWGPGGEILDYANKQWSGVIFGYYKMRWEVFLKTLTECLHDDRTFNETSFNEKVLQTVEIPFTLGDEYHTIIPKGDSLKISQNILRKYEPQLDTLQKLIMKEGKGTLL